MVELDTSGVVRIPRGKNGILTPQRVKWSDLNAFTQGALRQALEEFLAYGIGPNPHHFKKGYRHLAPATLQRIMEDCARFRSFVTVEPVSERAFGASYWKQRQAGELAYFPPLTLDLADDGLIHIREAAGREALTQAKSAGGAG